MKTSISRTCRNAAGAFPRNDEAALFPNGQRGFTLIELMIGLALGLIASLAIFLTISSFEAQRLTTASGVDMQQNGLLALYSIENDVRAAGFGLIVSGSSTPPSLSGSLPCGKVDDYVNSTVYNSAPVALTNGSTGTDIITINRLNSDTGGIVTGGHAATLNASFSAAGAMSLDTSAALHVNDFILVSEPGKDCPLLKVTANPSTTIGAAGVDVATAGNAVVNSALTPPAFPTYATAASAVVVDLGPASSVASVTTFGSSTNPAAAPTFATTKYQIDTNLNLIRSEDAGTTWNTVASNIVTVATQYGVATSGGGAAGGSGSISCWTDAIATTNSTVSACKGTDWSSPPAADIKRIKAIRVAIVARSAQKVSCTTTTAAPVAWTDSSGASPAPVIDLSSLVGSDWKCYRYKVYQTIIPIRNVIQGIL